MVTTMLTPFHDRLDRWIDTNSVGFFTKELTYLLIHPDDKEAAIKSKYEYRGLPFKVIGEGLLVEPEADKEARLLKEKKAAYKLSKQKFNEFLKNVL